MGKVALFLALTALVLSADILSVADLPKEIALKETILSPALETEDSDSSERTFSEIAIKAPLSQSVTNWARRPYIQFKPNLCKNRIEINPIVLDESGILQGIIQPFRPEENHTFNLTGPGTFQISSLDDSKPFSLNLVARSTAKLRQLTKNGTSYGIKLFCMKKKSVYSIQAEFALLVNGEERLRHAIGNSRSDRQYRGVRIRIDPNHLVDMKILEDF